MNLQTAAYRIFSESSPITNTIEVLSISVIKEANRVSRATIVAVDGDVAKQDFEVSGSDSLRVGKKISIELGFEQDLQTVFEGIVVKHSIRVRQNVSRIEIECMDECVFLTQIRKNRYFLPDTSDADAIKQILGESNITPDQIADTPHNHKQLVQYNITDWDFIGIRADNNGLLVLTDHNKLSLLKPQMGAAKQSVVFGMDIYEMDLQTDGRFHYETIKTKSWQPTEQKMTESSPQSSFSNAQGDFSTADLAKALNSKQINLQNTAHLAETELSVWADAVHIKSELSKIRGRISISGTHKLAIGDTISLEGAGSQFNGNAFLSGIAHIFSDGNWKTSLQLGLSPEWFSQKHSDLYPLPAEGLVSAIEGLHIGIVTKLAGDPDNEHRIKVRVPTISEAEEGIWVRIATLDAGKERGTIFRPEINDEVIVGFLNNDPRFPVLLGMLHSSKNAAPIPATDENHEKGIITRSKMELRFNDEKSIVTLKTPKGNTLVFDDEQGSISITDSNQNKLNMTKEGIEIVSAKDIKITAQGNITLAGIDITNNAKGKFAAEAQSGAEVKTSAIAVIKGSIVQIN